MDTDALLAREPSGVEFMQQAVAILTACTGHEDYAARSNEADQIVRDLFNVTVPFTWTPNTDEERKILDKVAPALADCICAVLQRRVGGLIVGLLYCFSQLAARYRDDCPGADVNELLQRVALGLALDTAR